VVGLYWKLAVLSTRHQASWRTPSIAPAMLRGLRIFGGFACCLLLMRACWGFQGMRRCLFCCLCCQIGML
jgi:hypothetical protein